MTKTKAAPRLTRKHMALARRERLVSRIVIVGVGLVLASVALLVGYGIVEQQVLIPRRPAAIVNGDPISRDELGARTALAQADLLQQRRSAEQMLAFFGDSPEIQQSLQQQIAQMDAQLSDTNYMAAQTLQTLIQARLIRQEAERRGITVTEADTQKAIEEAFGYFAGGTPTPAPSPTGDVALAAQQTADAVRRPTATSSTAEPTSRVVPPTSAATATSGPTVTPQATATAFTADLFEADWQQYLDDIKSSLGVGEDLVRDRFVDNLYRERLRESFAESVPREEEQVWARHILVSEEAVAQLVLDRLEQGEDWDAVAAEASLDTSNKDQGGDLGWFARGTMVDAFEAAAFDGAVGDIVGPVQSSFGWHLIWIVDRGMRRFDEAAYQTAVETAFSTWLAGAIEQAELTFDPQLVPPTAVPTATAASGGATPAVSATP